MELNPAQSGKVNAALRGVLASTTPNQQVRAVLVVRPSGQTVPDPPPLDPADFLDRVAFREAVIAQQKQLTETRLGPLFRTLAQFGLHPRGGELGAVVVEGPAQQLLAALNLEEVIRGMADAQVEPPSPRRQ